jgi:hypothetical protein
MGQEYSDDANLTLRGYGDKIVIRSYPENAILDIFKGSD